MVTVGVLRDSPDGLEQTLVIRIQCFVLQKTTAAAVASPGVLYGTFVTRDELRFNFLLCHLAVIKKTVDH